MEIYTKEIIGYKIIFIYNEVELKIITRDKNSNGNKKNNFTNLIFNLEGDFRKYFSNFKELIKQVKEKKIFIKISNNISIISATNKEINTNEYYFQLIKNDGNREKIIISKRIYTLNVKYYLTKGPLYGKINSKSKPFLSYLKSNYFNILDIRNLIDNENILSNYAIDDIKYFNEEKQIFQSIKIENIYFKDKLILLFHIRKLNNILLTNLKWKKNYFNNEIKKIKNIKNKFYRYKDIIRKYDLIYLYASPIIKDKDYSESKAPISYMEEIRIITQLMEKKNKKYCCKFECIGEDNLKDILINNKTKILHISAHGCFDKNYSLVIENLKENGQNKFIDIFKLNSFLSLCKNNLRQIDLVIVSTCYGQSLSDVFIKYGVKNVIFIEENVEIIDRISVIFTKFFYFFLLEGNSIKDSYNMAMDMIKKEEEVKNLNDSNSCCCNHYHNSKCVYSYSREKKRIHRNFHSLRIDKCKCKIESAQGNHHYDHCEYYQKILKEMPKCIKSNKKENNINIICCCNTDFKKDFNHNEITKILYKLNKDIKYDIFPFKFNEKGEIFINSKIRFNYDENKFGYIIGRKNIIGKIFNNIKNNGKFVILFGEKDLAKIFFAESLCVYLFERSIINNYEIFRINNEWDFNFMKDKIFQPKIINLLNLCLGKKIIIIKFNISDDKTSFKYFSDIVKIFNAKEYDKYYFIFIFNIPEPFDKKEIDVLFSEYIINNIDVEIKKYIKNNIFYIDINSSFADWVLEHFLKRKKINIKDENRNNLLKDKAKYKYKKIKILSELLLQGETYENITKMNELERTNVKLSENKSTFILYYLLLNMPSGLPDSFLKLIFKDFENIKDHNNLIIKSLDNWNFINKDKIFEEDFKDNKYMESCFIYLFETLKIYAKLLKYYIDKNREKIKYKNGEIHYLFNSYSNEDIWKSKISNIFIKLKERINLDKDYKIEKHIKNILNLISIIVIKFNSYSKIEEIKHELDEYLEDILLLFPSYFFLKKDNVEYIQKSIEFCNILSRKRIKKFELVKQKLLLFLYSVDEDKNEICSIDDIDINLKNELIFLQKIREKNKSNIDLEQLLGYNISDEMKFNVYREIAIDNYKQKNYIMCLKILENAINNNNININILFKQRVIVDSCFNLIKLFQTFFYEENQIVLNMVKYKLTKDELIKEKIEQLNQIIENPTKKNIYYESHFIKDEIYNLYQPSIVMLNSNPLKKISKYSYPLNNQYYILNELEKNLNYNARIKSYVLNEENLKKALDTSGKILIIQSDDYTEDGDIICESEDGQSYIFKKQDIYELIKDKIIMYELIILCFPKSSILKNYLLSNEKIDKEHYWITFESFDDSKINEQTMEEFNKICIQFLIDFIYYYVENNKEKIADVFNFAKKKFIDEIKNKKLEIFCVDYINLILDSEYFAQIPINYELNNDDNGIFLYGVFPKFDELDFNLNFNSKNLSSQVYDLIKCIERQNKLSIYCDETCKNINLKICFEAMKFFYRHKTFCELYYIDIYKDGKTLLKSLIKKLNKIRNIENEESESENEDDDDEYVEPRKACFILINNCTSQDLIDINIYSVLDSNSSFVILYNKGNIIYNHNQKGSLNIINSEQEKDNSLHSENKKSLMSNEKEISDASPKNLKDSSIKLVQSVSDVEAQTKILKDQKPQFKTPLSINDFEIIQKMGNAPNTFVEKAKYKFSGEIYAIKVYNKENSFNELDYFREKSILYDLTKRDNENIVKLYADFEDNNYNYLVMEYVEGKTLRNLGINGNIKDYIEQKDVINILTQILETLVFLHDDCHIIHRDINPDNIIVQKDGKIKLIDFGISVYLENTNKKLVSNKSFKGNIHYVAPEILFLETPYNYDGRLDIFSLGFTMYNLMNPSNTGIDNLPKITRYDEGNFIRIDQFVENKKYESWLIDFVDNLCEEDQNKRKTAQEALNLLDGLKNDPKVRQLYYELKFKQRKDNLENINVLFKRDNFGTNDYNSYLNQSSDATLFNTQLMNNNQIYNIYLNSEQKNESSSIINNRGLELYLGAYYIPNKKNNKTKSSMKSLLLILDKLDIMDSIKNQMNLKFSVYKENYINLFTYYFFDFMKQFQKFFLFKIEWEKKINEFINKVFSYNDSGISGSRPIILFYIINNIIKNECKNNFDFSENRICDSIIQSNYSTLNNIVPIIHGDIFYNNISKAILNFKNNYKGPLVDNFYFLILNVSRCPNCNNIMDIKIQVTQFLQLNVTKQQNNIWDLINNYFWPKIVDIENYQCIKCLIKGKKSITPYILNSPNYLILELEDRNKVNFKSDIILPLYNGRISSYQYVSGIYKIKDASEYVAVIKKGNDYSFYSDDKVMQFSKKEFTELINTENPSLVIYKKVSE